MGDCSQHKKEVAGISDMKLLAEMIGDLHYETLASLLVNLTFKFDIDANKDLSAGRVSLSEKLGAAAFSTANAADSINEAWQISKPFMDNANKI